MDFDYIEHQVLGDVEPLSIDEVKKYEAEDFVSYLESDDELELDSISDDDSDLSSDEIVDEENILKTINKSIKLDLWLKECTDQRYIDSFLKYKSITLEIDESPVSKIISSIELEELIKFKYRSFLNEFTESLKTLFLPLGIMQIVEIARKYDVKILLTKDGLIKNFLKKYSVYELIFIFSEEGLNITDYLNISVLEQIYLLTDSKLKEISCKLSSKEYDSKHEMISSIVNYYDDDYLISHEIFRGDAL